MKNKKFKYYADPSHGWIAVKRAYLISLDILDKVSSYSYQRGKTIYLEEDCDALLFTEAYMRAYGKTPDYIESHTKGNNRSPIRSYENFKGYVP